MVGEAGVQGLEDMQDILADLDHDLGEPIFWPGVIGDQLFLVVTMSLVAFEAALCMAVMVIVQTAQSVGVPDRELNALLQRQHIGLHAIVLQNHIDAGACLDGASAMFTGAQAQSL